MAKLEKTNEDVTRTTVADVTPEPQVSEVEKLAELTATIDGKKYTFPTTGILTIHEAVKLSQYFMPENLKVGQVFTFNYTMNAMLIVPELGLRMDSSNLTYTFKGDLGPVQTERLMHLVNSCAVLVGDIGAKTVPASLHESTLNCQIVLDKPTAVIRKDIVEILGKNTRILDDGSIDSPASDLQALLNFEVKNKNRKDVVDLLRKALNKIQGSVEFIAKMTDVKPIGKSNTKPGTSGPAPKGNPMIAQKYL